MQKPLFPWLGSSHLLACFWYSSDLSKEVYVEMRTTSWSISLLLSVRDSLVKSAGPFLFPLPSSSHSRILVRSLKSCGNSREKKYLKIFYFFLLESKFSTVTTHIYFFQLVFFFFGRQWLGGGGGSALILSLIKTVIFFLKKEEYFTSCSTPRTEFFRNG